ncbi:type II secretion system protein [Clostridium gasigenes]|uniref:type IV pilus modification PilV family protein n=1 Tax=Clostridium gasigenes TaxID=94869 RepID=UPI0014385F87|nr:type II secretion system protein [Clostridium gasigenes]NKF05321.1 type II secretion system protein [Clostridium gasigenes]QSW18774.1 type II secretion system protein [Clostridium gasigenes]
MKRKHKGSMLIEVLVGLMILMIASMMAMTSAIAANKSKIRRNKYEEANRVAYCIMNEIKYNYTYEEVESKMDNQNSAGVNNKYIGFRYTDNILENLITTNIFQLERGNDIKIEVINDDSNNKIMKIKIAISLSGGVGEVNVEREFNKSWWME